MHVSACSEDSEPAREAERLVQILEVVSNPALAAETLEPAVLVLDEDDARSWTLLDFLIIRSAEIDGTTRAEVRDPVKDDASLTTSSGMDSWCTVL